MKASLGPYAAVAFAPLLLIGMNVVYALPAYALSAQALRQREGHASFSRWGWRS